MIGKYTTEKEAEERVKKLRRLITYYRTLYHTFDISKISDDALDSLKEELAALERKFPRLVTKNSPTQIVGGRPLDEFKKVRHEERMLSFNDAFSREEMKEWVERLENYCGFKLEDKSIRPIFYCELKFDGLSIELVYNKGKLVRGSTRGDGIIGEDVTQNIMTVNDIPHNLVKMDKWNIPNHLVVRGEIYIEKRELERINKEREKKGLTKYANPRNLAAGSVRQLDPKVAGSRNLRAFFYDIIKGTPKHKTHEEEHIMMASWGIPINLESRPVNTLKEVFEYHKKWSARRKKLPYEIDGIVVLVNDKKIFNKAGAIGKAPRAGIAYKFSPKEATTIVKDIKIQIGRTGILTPVAVLEPVEIGGVVIGRATLHNFDEIKRLDIRVGDTVIVTRSGDVIPKIVKAFKELRPKDSKPFKEPKVCLFDGAKLIKDGVYVRCSSEDCGAKNINKIKHFISREAFNIDGLGKRTIDRFLDEGLISDVDDLFELEQGDIEVLKGFGKKSAENIINSINDSKTITAKRFLYALGILHVGFETAKLLADLFYEKTKVISVSGIRDFFRTISREELEDISGIGPIVADSICKWFGNQKNQKLLDKLHNVGIKIKKRKASKINKIFNGMSFVLTGALRSMSRKEAKDEIEKRGGNINNSVSLKTSVVVVGEDSGLKFDKAKELGITIWSEKKFLEKLRVKE